MCIFGFFIYVLSSFLPKRNWAVLQSYPTFDDNILEIESFLGGSKCQKIIILYPGLSVPPHNFIFSAKTIFVRRRSIRGVCYYIFSKYVFVTHGLYYHRFPSSQISVNLWHGMPIKRIGVQRGNKGLRTKYVLSTSDLFNKELQNAFHVEAKAIVNTNLPRNFRLLKKSYESNISAMLFGDNVNYAVWLPTYRRSLVGDVRLDGEVVDGLVNFAGFDLDRFNQLMKDLNMICLIKPHPMAGYTKRTQLSNVHVMDDEWLAMKGVSLYDLLGQSSFLISDVSSVMIDYTILKRPIYFCFSDKVKYSDTRGFNPSFNWDILPGELFSNFDEMCEKFYSKNPMLQSTSLEYEMCRSLYHETDSDKYLNFFLNSIINN
jgi:CDP-glycerol glycerophosphotransferase (TagB/SpsB family)